MMSLRTLVGMSFGLTLTWALGACNSVAPSGQEPTGLAADVATKAQEVAGEVGGPNGFGGPSMMGFAGHMSDHMGFHSDAYLGDPDGDLLVQLTNGSGFPCTFHLAYVQSTVGLDEQSDDVVVQPGETIQVQMPCAEIMGVGSLTNVGAVAVNLPDGNTFDNRYCVPGFLNSDYTCGGTFGCVLAPDTNDVDQDGDTEELIVLTSGMQSHMGSGGMGQHMWDYDDTSHGMMGGQNGPMMGGYTGAARP